MKKLLWYVLGVGALMMALVVVGVLPTAEASSGTKIDAIGQQGPYAVGFTSYVLTDNSRQAPDGYLAGGRPIPVYLLYPADPGAVNASTPKAEYPMDMLNMPNLMTLSEEWEAMGYDPAYQEPPVSDDGPFPVLLISHGWTPPPWFMLGIATRLASHGFIVAVPSHVGDERCYGWEPARDHMAMMLWNRPRDLSFVLTDLEQRNSAAGGLLSSAIDPSRVASSGWSAGGYASMVLAGGDDTVWDYAETDGNYIDDGPIPENVPLSPSLPDPRIKAIIILDGANQDLKFEEMARVKVPALSLGQEWSTKTTPPYFPAWHARQHAAFSGHPNYRVDIWGTNHFSFSAACDAMGLMASRGIATTMDGWIGFFCPCVIPAAVSRDIITRYMIAFLKTELLGETGYQKMLTPGWALTQETLVEFFVTEKRNANSIDVEWPDDSVYFQHQPGRK